MGIIIYVYRDADSGGYDCTNNGISSRYTRMCVVNADGPFKPDDDRPPVLLVKHPTVHYVYIVPLQEYYDGRHTMFGGNFAYSCDSRFVDAVRNVLGDHNASVGAIQIHDRI